MMAVEKFKNIATSAIANNANTDYLQSQGEQFRKIFLNIFKNKQGGIVANVTQLDALYALFPKKLLQAYSISDLCELKFLGFNTKHQSPVVILTDKNNKIKVVATRHIKDESGNIVKDKKWIRIAGSTNNFISCNIKDDASEVAIAEGISEAQLFEILGMSYICFQNAGEMSKFDKNPQKDEILTKLKGKTTLCFVDNDEAGESGFNNLLPIISGVASQIYKIKFENSEKGYDFRDFVVQISSKFYDNDLKQNIEKGINERKKLVKFQKESIFSKLQRHAITAEQIRNHKTAWLIPSFLAKQSLVNIYAASGSGKSIFALHLSISLLKDDKIKSIYYIDADNGIGTLQRRNLDSIIETYKSSFRYICANIKDENGEYLDKNIIIDELAKYAKSSQNKYDDCLIILDSIRDFIKGDMLKDYCVIPALDNLKKLRDSGATVIFLHHQPKYSNNPKEKNKTYKGATAFADSVDEAWYFENKSKRQGTHEMIAILEPLKQRDETRPQAFIVNTDTFSFIADDYFKYALNEKEHFSIDLATKIIGENPQGINQSALAIKIRQLGENNIVGTNHLWDLLRRFESINYKTIRSDKNSKIYLPLQN